MKMPLRRARSILLALCTLLCLSACGEAPVDPVDEPIFLPDLETTEELQYLEKGEITESQNVLLGISGDAYTKGQAFAKEIKDNIITDFKKEGDKMVHVSTYTIINGTYYMTYYANTETAAEDPLHQKARLVYCPVDDVDNKTYIDLQCAGDTYEGKSVDGVYDTILMQQDDETLYLLWTAQLSGNYYRLYRTFTVATGELGPIRVNRLQAGDSKVDFSVTGIQTLFAKEGIPCKEMYSDIGIMQKITARKEKGKTYYYTGAYSGDLNFIIKSTDFITWEYVAQPDFVNLSKWENAVYVVDNKAYYFVRQWDESDYGFLTYYDLKKEIWATPVLIEDCQSRSDFIMYEDELYLVHAPGNRKKLGIVYVDHKDLSKTRTVLRAEMHESCFYPFVQFCDGELYLSYTSNRQKIMLSKFDAATYLTVPAEEDW